MVEINSIHKIDKVSFMDMERTLNSNVKDITGWNKSSCEIVCINKSIYAVRNISNKEYIFITIGASNKDIELTEIRGLNSKETRRNHFEYMLKIDGKQLDYKSLAYIKKLYDKYSNVVKYSKTNNKPCKIDVSLLKEKDNKSTNIKILNTLKLFIWIYNKLKEKTVLYDDKLVIDNSIVLTRRCESKLKKDTCSIGYSHSNSIGLNDEDSNNTSKESILNKFMSYEITIPSINAGVKPYDINYLSIDSFARPGKLEIIQLIILNEVESKIVNEILIPGLSGMTAVKMDSLGLSRYLEENRESFNFSDVLPLSGIKVKEEIDTVTGLSVPSLRTYEECKKFMTKYIKLQAKRQSREEHLY